MDLLRSLPIGLYIEKPQTWIHQLDPRTKLLWAVGILLVCILTEWPFRWAMVGLFFIVSLLSGLPARLLVKQWGGLFWLGALVLGSAILAPDGLLIDPQPRSPVLGTNLPQPTDYTYTLAQLGFLSITRYSLEFGLQVTASLLLLFVGTNLLLTTTAPEELALGVERLLSPLKRWGVDVDEVVLTLALALRFFPLVVEEVQNLVRSVRTRGIDWKRFSYGKQARLLLMVSSTLVENLFTRSGQIAQAMYTRGYTGPSNRLAGRTLSFSAQDFWAFGVFGLCLLGRFLV
ncbi:MAG: energy-coupling factor transporter transmembrane component T [Gloeobacterales cyanobacterium]